MHQKSTYENSMSTKKKKIDCKQHVFKLVAWDNKLGHKFKCKFCPEYYWYKGNK